MSKRFVLFLLLSCIHAQAAILRVRSGVVGGTGDGSSWANAYPYLQNAIIASNTGDEIWVAAGTYYPDEGTSQTNGSSSAKFSPQRSISLFGGFSGTETLKTERNPAQNLTILSGDISQDDIDVDGNQITESSADLRGTNSVSVVTFTNTSTGGRLDGFTITGGSSSGTATGAGLNNARSSLLVTRCHFLGNRAGSGGAVRNAATNTIFSNCIFSGNSVTFDGGAVSNSSQALFTNCLFFANTALRNGGAFYNTAASPNLSQCTLTGNSALAGGALYNATGGFPNVQNSILWNNRANGSTSTASASVASASSSFYPRFSSSLIANSGGSTAWVAAIGTNQGNNLDADPKFLFPPPFGTIPPTLDGLRPAFDSPVINTGSNSNLPQDSTDLDNDGNLTEPIPLDLAGAARVNSGTTDMGVFELENGPAIIAAPARLRLAPNSGIQLGAFDLSTVFDATATTFALVHSTSANVATVAFNAATGQIDLTPLPDTIGEAILVVTASNATGLKSYLTLKFEVFPDVVYVDSNATGTGTGLNWANAFPTLQDALVRGGSQHQLWVAQGNYRPDTGGGQTNNSADAKFILPSGVSLHGGFSGTETNLSQRPPATYSILSGDVGEDDLNADGDFIAESTANIVGSNSATILEISNTGNTTHLDRWIITGAGKTSTQASGGGLKLSAASPQISDCRFLGNRAATGGAVSVEKASVPAFSDCHFQGNLAPSGAAALSDASSPGFLRCVFTGNTASTDGGAILNRSNTVATYTDCDFQGNTAATYGGAIRNTSSTINILRCEFSGNSLTNTFARGGAISNSFTSGTCRDSQFTGNSCPATSSYGGAIYGSVSPVAFVGCEFTGSLANEGGAIFIDSGSPPSLTNCRLAGNSARSEGGAIYINAVDPLIIGCEFTGNKAITYQGGALYNDASSPVLVNCSLSGNSSGWSGGAIYNQTWNTNDPAAPSLTNCIIWNNQAQGASNTPAASIADSSDDHPTTLSHCLIANSSGSASWNPLVGVNLGSNLDIDPRFLVTPDPASAPTLTGDLRLQSNSPVINAGNSSALPADSQDVDSDNDLIEILPLDRQGKARLFGIAVDIGAFETESGPQIIQPIPRLRFDPLTGLHSSALLLASHFDASAVSFGIDSWSPSHILTPSVNPATGALDIEIQPNQFGTTVVVVSAVNAAGHTSYSTVTIDVFPPVVFVDAHASGLNNGLTWTNAFTTVQSALAIATIPGINVEIWVANGVYYPDDGPGQTNNATTSSFKLFANCSLYGGFSGNETQRSQRDPEVNLTILSGDLAQDDSNTDGNFIAETATAIVGTNATSILIGDGTGPADILDGFTITAGYSLNSSSGALSITSGSPTIRSCVFRGNRAINGGAVRLNQSPATFTDCRFLANKVASPTLNFGTDGGAVLSIQSSPTFTRCLFQDNTSVDTYIAGASGGAIASINGGSLTLTDCDFIHNSSLGEGGALVFEGTTLILNGCRFLQNSTTIDNHSWGGAVKATATVRTTINRCEFTGNNTPSEGGAIYMSANAPLDCVNSVFKGNSSRSGGAILLGGSSPARFTNCQFTGNVSSGVGGAVYCAASDTIFSQCLFSANRAAQTGGAIYQYPSSNGFVPRFRNSILWNNQSGGSTASSEASIGTQVYSEVTASFSACIIQNSGGSSNWKPGFGVNGGNNQDADPRFVLPLTPLQAPSAAGDFRLQGNSPAINAGLAASLPADVSDLDLDGNLAESLPVDISDLPRSLGASVDLGPYESETGPAIVAAQPQVELNPDSGNQTGLISLAGIFDSSAVGFALTSMFPANTLSISVHPTLGTLTLNVPPGTIGHFIASFSAVNGSGQTSFYSIIFDVFPDVLHVDASATGAGTGLSWADAFPTLQHALSLGGTGYEIWVAEGRYLPDQGPGQTNDNPAATFALTDGVAGYGGFSGSESLRASRSPATHPTILSGDLGGDDLNLDGNQIAESHTDIVGANSRSIVTGSDTSATTILDGFTITAGNATMGGGLFIDHGQPTIRNCSFQGNRAENGGGVGLDHGSAPRIESCELSGNLATSTGGAICLEDSSAIVSRCEIRFNQAAYGGGIGATASTLDLIQTPLSVNHATSGGGALYIDRACRLTAANCILSGNIADTGGALFNLSGDVSMKNCTVTGNTGRLSAGGLYHSYSNVFVGVPTFTNCIIWNNLSGPSTNLPSSSSYYFSLIVPRFVSCVIANSKTGGVWNTSIGTDGGGNLNADPLFLSPVDTSLGLTSTGNLRLQSGSPAIDAGNSPALPTDTTDIDLDGNTTEILPFDLAELPRLQGTAVDIGAYETAASGPAVVAALPTLRFLPDTGSHPAAVQASAAFGATAIRFEIVDQDRDDIVTAVIQPLTGQVDLTVLPARFGRTSISIGAFNAADRRTLLALTVDVVPERVFVNPLATGTASGLSWENAFTNLQQALVNPVDGYEIWVAAGIYQPDQGFRQIHGSRYAHFRLRDHVALYGGFSGNESARSSRDPLRNNTILSGNVGLDPGNTAFNAYTVVLANDVHSDCRLDGFVVTGGQANSNFLTDSIYVSGGGIYLENASPEIVNCRLSGNSSLLGGAGMFIQGTSQPWIARCTFSGGISYNAGGGGVAVGGAATPIFSSCAFLGNSASIGGAASIGNGSNVTFTNCTFTGNNATTSGGAIHNAGSINLSNGILWNNRAANSTATATSSIFNTAGSTATHSHCLTANSGGSAAWNSVLGINQGSNLDSNPRFLVSADPTTTPNSVGDLQLTRGSAALDAGNNSAVVDATDLPGQPRIVHSTVDLGAYEGQNDQLDTDDDGLSDAFELKATSPASRTALAPLEDSDHDGIINQLEFVFGTNPLLSDSTGNPSHSVSETGGNRYFSLTYRRNIWASQFFDIQLERSTSLAEPSAWSVGQTTRTGSNWPSPETEEISERSNFPMNSQNREFLRVRTTPRQP